MFRSNSPTGGRKHSLSIVVSECDSSSSYEGKPSLPPTSESGCPLKVAMTTPRTTQPSWTSSNIEPFSPVSSEKYSAVSSVYLPLNSVDRADAEDMQQRIIFTRLREEYVIIEEALIASHEQYLNKTEEAFLLARNEIEISQLKEQQRSEISQKQAIFEERLSLKATVRREKALTEGFSSDAKLRDMKIFQKASDAKLARHVQQILDQNRQEFEETIAHVEKIHSRKCKNLSSIQESRNTHDKTVYEMEIKHLNMDAQNLMRKRYGAKANHQKVLDKKSLDQLKEVQRMEILHIKELFNLKHACTDEALRLRTVQQEALHALDIKHCNERREEKVSLAALKDNMKAKSEEEQHMREVRKLIDRHRMQLCNLNEEHEEKLRELQSSANSTHRVKVSLNALTDSLEPSDERNSLSSSVSSFCSNSRFSSTASTESLGFAGMSPSSLAISPYLRSALSIKTSSSDTDQEPVKIKEEKMRLSKIRQREARARLVGEHNEQLLVLHEAQGLKMSELKKQHDHAMMQLQRQHDYELMELRRIHEKEVVLEQNIHEAESRIMAERKILGSVLDSVIDGIIIIDTNASILRINSAIPIIFGYSSEEILGENIDILMPSGMPINHQAIIYKYMQTGTKNVIGRGRVLKGRKKDGTEFNIHLSVTEIKQEGVHLFTGVIRDITNDILHEQMMAEKVRKETDDQEKILAAEKRRTEEAESSRNQQERYIDMICHEIRNPLNGIQNNNELLTSLLSDLSTIIKERYKMDEELSDLLDSTTDAVSSIALCAKHQKSIADDCLNMSKLNMNLVKISTTTALDPVILAKTVFDGFAEEARKMKILLKLELREGLENLTLSETQHLGGDPARLAQVLSSLIANALKSTADHQDKKPLIMKDARPKVIVEIDVKHIEDETITLQFAIIDMGPGMTPVEQKLLVQQFNQASYKTHADYGGSGLGLYIAKELITLMGGSIQVRSVKGEGSTISFTIKTQLIEEPVTKSESTSQSANILTTEEKSYRPILIADDSSINRKVLRAQLERSGYECEEAENGEEALKAFNDNPAKFGLILMDLEMPILDGRQAAVKIRELENRTAVRRSSVQFPIAAVPTTAPKKRIPIIAVTGNTFFTGDNDPMNFGFQSVLVKPFTRNEVLTVVRNFCMMK
ncbi:hypothetical protein BDR26DRAFT_917072 [Obelidium mucronatum]|nr:hypothetical protein BDR26DRAFT_917072 [Obelidium mucronatum]